MRCLATRQMALPSVDVYIYTGQGLDDDGRPCNKTDVLVNTGEPEPEWELLDWEEEQRRAQDERDGGGAHEKIVVFGQKTRGDISKFKRMGSGSEAIGRGHGRGHLGDVNVGPMERSSEDHSKFKRLLERSRGDDKQDSNREDNNGEDNNRKDNNSSAQQIGWRDESATSFDFNSVELVDKPQKPQGLQAPVDREEEDAELSIFKDAAALKVAEGRDPRQPVRC
jgi:hypothetical protein